MAESIFFTNIIDMVGTIRQANGALARVISTMDLPDEQNSQGGPLMEGTVRDNICYGCERPVSEDELVAVAKQARVYDFVSKLPDGFDTVVASGG